MNSTTESYYVSFETAKILKKRGYVPDYAGRDNAYDQDGNFINPRFNSYFSSETKPKSEDLYPCPSWQDAFRFLRERWGVYAYVERDTYHHMFRFVSERDTPRGEHISMCYDTIDMARNALFKHLDEEIVPRIYRDPSFYKYTPFSKEEEEEIKRVQEETHRNWILKNLRKASPENIEEFIKEHPENEEWIREGLRQNEDKD